jgi:hypothetical protein
MYAAIKEAFSGGNGAATVDEYKQAETDVT